MMMSVQKRMIAEGYLIKLVVLIAVQKYGNLLLEVWLAKMSLARPHGA